MSVTIEMLVKCPFWQYTAKNTLMCEGVVPDTCMITRFPNAAAKRQHIKHYCYHEDGGKCPLAVSLYRKYEEDT